MNLKVYNQVVRRRNVRNIQNFIVVWLDNSIDAVNSNDHHRIIRELQQVVSIVNIFTNVHECVDFINDFKEENIILILSETFGETTVPIIHELSHVSVIYVFPGNKTKRE